MTRPSAEQLLCETARLAYHLHWPLDTILDLEHADRRRFLADVEAIAAPAAAPGPEAAPEPEAAKAVPSSALIGGLSSTEREWLFGDPQKALAQALPVSPRTLNVDPEVLQRQRVQRLLSRGGLE